MWLNQVHPIWPLICCASLGEVGASRMAYLERGSRSLGRRSFNSQGTCTLGSLEAKDLASFRREGLCDSSDRAVYEDVASTV